MRVDLPFGCVTPDQPDGLFTVLNRPRFLTGGKIRPRHSVFENHSRHADRVQPARYRMSFFVHGQMGVTTAGANDHGNRAGLVTVRQVNSERGDRDVTHSAVRLVRAAVDDQLRLGIRNLWQCIRRPQRNLYRLGCKTRPSQPNNQSGQQEFSQSFHYVLPSDAAPTVNQKLAENSSRSVLELAPTPAPTEPNESGNTRMGNWWQHQRRGNW